MLAKAIFIISFVLLLVGFAQAWELSQLDPTTLPFSGGNDDGIEPDVNISNLDDNSTDNNTDTNITTEVLTQQQTADTQTNSPQLNQNTIQWFQTAFEAISELDKELHSDYVTKDDFERYKNQDLSESDIRKIIDQRISETLSSQMENYSPSKERLSPVIVISGLFFAFIFLLAPFVTIIIISKQQNVVKKEKVEDTPHFKQLISYLKHNNHIPTHILKSQLLKTGWKPEEIESAFKKIKG